MPRILIVFASTHGHTGRIAARLGDGLRAAGMDPDVRAVADAGDCDPRDYDAVVAGGSVHLGRHQDGLVRWARSRARALDTRPSAFFSVCLAVADGTHEGRGHAQDWIDDFADDTGWTP